MNDVAFYCLQSIYRDIQDRRNGDMAGSSLDHAETHGTRCTLAKIDPFRRQRNWKWRRMKKSPNVLEHSFFICVFLLSSPSSSFFLCVCPSPNRRNLNQQPWVVLMEKSQSSLELPGFLFLSFLSFFFFLYSFLSTFKILPLASWPLLLAWKIRSLRCHVVLYVEHERRNQIVSCRITFFVDCRI